MQAVVPPYIAVGPGSVASSPLSWATHAIQQRLGAAMPSTTYLCSRCAPQLWCALQPLRKSPRHGQARTRVTGQTPSSASKQCFGQSQIFLPVPTSTCVYPSPSATPTSRLGSQTGEAYSRRTRMSQRLSPTPNLPSIVAPCLFLHHCPPSRAIKKLVRLLVRFPPVPKTGTMVHTPSQCSPRTAHPLAERCRGRPEHGRVVCAVPAYQHRLAAGRLQAGLYPRLAGAQRYAV
jgi:hypothetical protein